MKLKDLTGQKFNYLTVLKRVENTKKGQARWECKCKCGKTLIVRSTDLLSGHTSSCGCWRTELNTIHNSSNNRLYHVYMGMNYPTLQGRLKKGWSFEDAITIPIRKCSRITKAEEE